MLSSKPTDALSETDASGNFVRRASGFREIIDSNHPVFKPESGRYHLYLSYAWWVQEKLL
jgi:putative glutathione S-transferase